MFASDDNFLRENNGRHQFHPMVHPQITRAYPPQIIVSGDGSTVTDIDGNTYIDGIGGLWNVNVGHNRREVKEAIVAQMEKISYYSSFVGTATAPSIELSHRLTQIASEENITKVLFSANGSDAVETALKLARQYWKLMGEASRYKYISLKQGYHGIHFGGTSISGGTYYKTAYEPLLPGCSQIDTPWLYRNPYTEDPTALAHTIAELLEREILHQGPQTVAAFIAEPVQGAGGVIVPPAEFWPLVRKVCDKYNVLMIADEVVTGFGRSGSMFGSRGWGVKPDMMCLAKGISSGYIPMGATALSKRVADAWYGEFSQDGFIMHGYTSTGHPLGCAASLAVLDIVEKENLPQNAAIQGTRLLEGLKSITEWSPIVGEVRGKGLMVGIDLVSDKETRQQLDPGTGIGEQIAAFAREKGVMARPAGSTIILSPPLVITAAQIDQVIDSLHYAFKRQMEG